MKRIGLTGNIGSGKSTIAHIFEHLDVPVFYSDVAAKNLYNRDDVRKAVQLLFPQHDFFKAGIFQKSALATLVFSQPEALGQLNKLIHPLVEAEFQQWVKKQTAAPYVVQESAILFEHGLQTKFLKVVVVSAPENIRLNRIQQRDGLSAKAISERMKTQMPEEQKIALADFVITNDSQQMLIPQVLAIHRELLKIP